MPFSAKRPPKDLKKKIKAKYPTATEKDIRQFVHVFNSVYDKTESEEKAYAQAWGSLKKKKKKKADTILNLIKIANECDLSGLTQLADKLDEIIFDLTDVASELDSKLNEIPSEKQTPPEWAFDMEEPS